MRAMIDNLLYLNDFHWRGSAFQWFFYAGILLTLIFEKRKMHRIVFGLLPLLYLACIFNPLCLELMRIAGVYNAQYFARMFSFMPLMYVIARGCTLLLRFNNAWLKLAAVGVICAIIVLTGKNIYSEPWLTKAANHSKAPRDTFEIVAAIEGQTEGPARIAVIDESVYYIRQVADVITPYGRQMGELGNQLSADPPDVQQVMNLAGQQDMDYVVSHKTDTTLAAFAENGYEPFAVTTNYAIFKVEDVSRIRRELNDKRQIVTKRYYNSLGEPEATKDGYYAEHYGYDASGRCTKVSYLDRDGTSFIMNGGYSSYIRDYYLNGYVKSISYLDQYDQPILLNGRYKTKYDYNIKGQRVREYYYDDAGKLMNRTDTMYAIREITYNASGKIESEKYLDENGNPVISAGGYAGISYEYDDQSQVINKTYYDVDGTEIEDIGTD